MKVYNITFVEECTSQVKIKAETLEKAKEIVNSGDFSGDEIIERDHFQITESYEESADQEKMEHINLKEKYASLEPDPND